MGDNCIHGNGSLGVPIKIVLYSANAFTGRTTAVVRAIGGFVLETMYHNQCNSCIPQQDKGEIIGYFDTFSVQGTVGSGGNSTLVRPILVR